MSKKDLVFQILDWYSQDAELEDGEDDNSSNDSNEYKKRRNKYKVKSKYLVTIFGRTETGKSVSVHLKDFPPFFYIKLPDNFQKGDIELLEEWIRTGEHDKNGETKLNMYKSIRHCLLRVSLVKRKKFRGFTNNKKFKFARLVFSNMRAYYCVRNLFIDKIRDSISKRTNSYPKKVTIPGIAKNFQFDLYESNIDPMIRLIHIRDVLPTGWVRIPKREIGSSADLTYCDIDITTRWSNINKVDRTDNCPIRMAFYDIECDSSHGDFPLAKKTYVKLAREISMEYGRLYGLYKKYKSDHENDHTEKISKLLEKIAPEKTMQFTYDMLTKAFKKGWEEHNISSIFMKKPASHLASNELITKFKNEKKQRREVLKRLSSDINHLVSTNYLKLGLSKMEINKMRNNNITKVEKVMDRYLPPIEGDHVIQIATCFIRYGEEKTYLDHILTLGTCDPIEGVEVVACKTERELLLRWTRLLRKQDVDIISGYNIYSFDFPYIHDRAEELDCLQEYNVLGKFRNKHSVVREKILSSSALGDNSWREIDTIGRIQIDLYKVVQRDFNLASYKLDAVSSHFMKGKVLKILESNIEYTCFETDNTKGIEKESYLVFTYYDGHSEEKHQKGHKYRVQRIIDNKVYVEGKLELGNHQYSWSMAKDDVSPQDIFRLQKGSSSDRCIIAKYCVKDVILCVELMKKLKILANNIGMSNVCYTPLSWIFMRGQGAKIFSLVAKQCREDNYLLPVLYNDEKNEGYEGAIVLKPNPGIYLEQPVGVLDYSSLYPSSMISENLSHDSIVEDEKWLGDDGKQKLEKLGYEIEDITYDLYQKINDKKVKVGLKTCRFVQFPNGEKGLIPRVLMKLLTARKESRKKIKFKTVTLKDGREIIGLVSKKEDTVTVITGKKETIDFSRDDIVSEKDTYNPFEKAVWDGLQLAYKVTANSLYGQIGASTSPIRWIDIAASTTATGRNLLHSASQFVLDNYQECNFKDYYIKSSQIVYGDTDSIFVKFDIFKDSSCIKKIIGKEALRRSIEICVDVQNKFQNELKEPHTLEYEKHFFPFILFSKKRYVGNKYEFDINKYKQTSMGIVLKRRDNAQLVKVVYGGIIDIIMNQQDIKASINFLQRSLRDLIFGKFPMEKLIITKSLRGFYKDPERIAHKVLADRMGERDPGNKPKANDRIPYVYVDTGGKKVALQGDRIEHPDYIRENKLKPDYNFYITNQILKPVCQIYGLIVEKLSGFRQESNYYEKQYKKLIRDGKEESKAKEKIRSMREKMAKELLFDPVIDQVQRNKASSMWSKFGFTVK